MSASRYAAVNTPFGTITLLASKSGLQAVQLGAPQMHDVSDAAHDETFMQPYLRAFEAYLKGQSQTIDVALDISCGTALQRLVWKELQRVPYGQTISYSELAKRCRKPAAVRAVASACGKNPLPLVIPCHRITAKDGSLGGFTWGLQVKSWLLSLEQPARKVA